MQARHVVNQDRDEVFTVDEMTFMYTMPVMHEGKMFGCNLLTLSGLLGTFDTEELAKREIESITSCKSEIYTISGYCPEL